MSAPLMETIEADEPTPAVSSTNVNNNQAKSQPVVLTPSNRPTTTPSDLEAGKHFRIYNSSTNLLQD